MDDYFLYGIETVIDLHDCDGELISSEPKLRAYLKKIVRLLDMVPYGAPIVEREAIALMLAAMKQDLELGQSLLARAAGEIASASAAAEPAALAMAHLGPAGVKHAVNAVQILGGYGFIRDYPCEKWLRDAKMLEVLLGSAERQQLWVLDRLRRPRAGREPGRG